MEIKRKSSSVRHAGPSVMVCTCMAANGAGTLAFLGDFSADRGSTMNAEVYRSNLCAHI